VCRSPEATHGQLRNHLRQPMANFATTDRGADQGRICIELDAAGNPRACTVEIEMTDGSRRVVRLSGVEAAALLTAGERAAVQTAMPKLYTGGVAKAGGV
jgi:hypothetical protein